MARLSLSVLMLCSSVAGCLAIWKPADGVVDLNAVEQALHKVENAPLTQDQRKASTRVVNYVDKLVTQIKSGTNLTKAQKMSKARIAIQELQGLQSQWQLSAVEQSLAKIVGLPHLSTEQRAAAKKVVADVEATVEKVETGKLTGAVRNQQVGFAIKELESLQREWLNVTTSHKVKSLQEEIAAKKALLKKDEMELKMAGLMKQLAEQKLMLKKLVAQKDQSVAEEKQSKEDAAQEATVAKLFATAKALTAKKNQTQQKGAPLQVVGAAAADPTLAALMSNLEARKQNLTASMKSMDAEEKSREAEMAQSIEAGRTPVQKWVKAPERTDAPSAVQKKLVKQEQLEQLVKQQMKQEHRSYLKARSLKEAQRTHLSEGIRSIQKGDVASLSRLMQKMETETKSMQAKAKNFLY